jgi:hypothetical protein
MHAEDACSPWNANWAASVPTRRPDQFRNQPCDQSGLFKMGHMAGFCQEMQRDIAGQIGRMELR